jgi:hypothetical protein
MSAEEERLRRLLKGAVPQPPAGLAADQVMSRPGGRTAGSWALPALAAAAVVAIAVTIGVLAARHAGPAAPAAGRATGTGQPTASSSPQPTTSCPGATVVVPNVIGTTFDAAGAILQGVGLNVGAADAVLTSSRTTPPGTVTAQSLPAGSRAVPGAVVWISTRTAAPTDPSYPPNVSESPMPCQSMAGTPPAPDATARVPNVIGMQQSQAVAVAEQAGFRHVSVTTAAPPTGQSVPPGTVFAQSPAAGSAARPPGMILYVAPAS